MLTPKPGDTVWLPCVVENGECLDTCSACEVGQGPGTQHTGAVAVAYLVPDRGYVGHRLHAGMLRALVRGPSRGPP